MMKTTTLLLLVLLFAKSLSAQVNLQLGLIANYSMNNSPLDATSNHLDLTPFGSPSGTTDRFGTSNGAYEISSLNPDYFTVQNSLLAPTEITVAAWVNLTDAAADQKVAGKCNVGSGYLLGVDSNKIDPEFWDSYSVHYRHKAGHVPSNAWTHLAISFKANDYVKSYINGALVDSFPTGTFLLGTTTSWPFTVGGAPWQPTALNMDGYIDDIFVYDRAINAAEDMALFSLITSTIDHEPTIGGTVYPVPLHNNQMHLEFKNSVTGEVHIRIFDSTGTEVYASSCENLKSTDLNLGSLSNGIYNLSLINGNRLESHRIVIAR
jgi:hypothetical protein